MKIQLILMSKWTVHNAGPFTFSKGHHCAGPSIGQNHHQFHNISSGTLTPILHCQSLKHCDSQILARFHAPKHFHSPVSSCPSRLRLDSVIKPFCSVTYDLLVLFQQSFYCILSDSSHPWTLILYPLLKGKWSVLGDNGHCGTPWSRSCIFNLSLTLRILSFTHGSFPHPCYCNFQHLLPGSHPILSLLVARRASYSSLSTQHTVTQNHIDNPYSQRTTSSTQGQQLSLPGPGSTST